VRAAVKAAVKAGAAALPPPPAHRWPAGTVPPTVRSPTPPPPKPRPVSVAAPRPQPPPLPAASPPLPPSPAPPLPPPAAQTTELPDMLWNLPQLPGGPTDMSPGLLTMSPEVSLIPKFWQPRTIAIAVGSGVALLLLLVLA
jgi:hypothetical protein